MDTVYAAADSRPGTGGNPAPGFVEGLRRGLAEASGRIRTGDLSLYDGDHLVVEPLHVTEAEVYDAVLDLRRRFYAWPSVFRRWLRLGAVYLRGRRALPRLGPFALLTCILLSLSRFRRAHTRRHASLSGARSAPVPSG